MTNDKRPPLQGTLAAEVSTLWTAHLAAPFPDGLRWVDAARPNAASRRMA